MRGFRSEMAISYLKPWAHVSNFWFFLWIRMIFSKWSCFVFFMRACVIKRCCSMVITCSLGSLFWLICCVPTAFSVQHVQPSKIWKLWSVRVTIQQNADISGSVWFHLAFAAIWLPANRWPRDSICWLLTRLRRRRASGTSLFLLEAWLHFSHLHRPALKHVAPSQRLRSWAFLPGKICLPVPGTYSLAWFDLENFQHTCMSEAENTSAKGVSLDPNPSKGPAYDPVTAKQIEEHHEKLRFHLDAIRDLKKEHAAAVKNRQAKAMPMAATGPKAPAVQAAPKQLGSSKSSSSAEQPPVKSRPQVWQTYTGHFWGACFFSVLMSPNWGQSLQRQKLQTCMARWVRPVNTHQRRGQIGWENFLLLLGPVCGLQDSSQWIVWPDLPTTSGSRAAAWALIWFF